MVVNPTGCKWNTAVPIRIGIDIKYHSNQTFRWDNRFRTVYFKDNASKDFLDFDVDGRRIIPRRFVTKWIGNFEIPINVKLFEEFWKRSKFVDCVGLRVLRNEKEATVFPLDCFLQKVNMPGQSSTDILARLRDELIDNGMYPYLNSGTLLGWYRECSMIPHTGDMDLAVSFDNYNPEYLKKLQRNHKTQFRIKRKLGEVADSFEMTVIPKKERSPKIDIFLMYDGIENGTITHSYISGLGDDGTKYRFSYPIYDPWCAAEMHNHLFWVSCTPKQKIVFELGDYWYLDKPTSTYIWNKSGKNVKTVGKFTEEQMKDVYITY
ncbi:unnamed protein product [Caenorhabditis brenneri]